MEIVLLKRRVCIRDRTFVWRWPTLIMYFYESRTNVTKTASYHILSHDHFNHTYFQFYFNHIISVSFKSHIVSISNEQGIYILARWQQM
jgi:hypothetical protein